MPWNPDIYNQFKGIRFQPFFDLADLISEKPGMQAVDLGCGTGEQTAILAERFKTAHFLGIDSSAEMLRDAALLENEGLVFRQSTTEDWLQEDKIWDLIFSNAALQWSDDHENLFPQLISKLRSGGQLAVQMPYQPGNILNNLLFDLASEEPFRSQLKGWNRASTVLTLDDYAGILFDNGIQNIQLMQKVYPIIADDTETLFRFISGSALIPYMERLNPGQGEVFTEEFRKRIAGAFPKYPAIYAFKRLFIYGVKK